jgi:dihydroflavonol-4-reductase
MTVAVTGANGHIGANLVRALIDSGRPTRSLVHVHTGAIEGLDTELVHVDVRDLDSLVAAFRGAEVVYHLAACISISMNSWNHLESVNVNGTRNVVEACLQAGVRRLIHFSSIHALVQEPMGIPVDESRPPAEASSYPPYDRSKAAGEREVRRGIEKGLDAVIIYPTAIIGPYDYEPSYLGGALISIARRELPALVTGGYDWVDVRDVVAGALNAEKLAPSGSSYLLSGHWVSIPDIAAMISDISGTSTRKITLPLWVARLGVPFIKAISRLKKKRPLYTEVSLRALRSNRHISHDKAAREIGYRTRSFRETITDTLQWFRENGYMNDIEEDKSGGHP